MFNIYRLNYNTSLILTLVCTIMQTKCVLIDVRNYPSTIKPTECHWSFNSLEKTWRFTLRERRYVQIHMIFGWKFQLEKINDLNFWLEYRFYFVQRGLDFRINFFFFNLFWYPRRFKSGIVYTTKVYCTHVESPGWKKLFPRKNYSLGKMNESIFTDHTKAYT